MAGKFNIKRADIKNPAPGFSHKAYIGVLTDFTTVETATDGVIAGDHAFDVGDGFMEVLNAESKPEMNSSANGSGGNMGPDVYVQNLFIPGDSVEVQDAVDAIRNEELIVLVQDATQAGTVWQYGNAQNPAHIIAVNKQSGTLGNGEKGTMIQIQAVNRYDYQGTITSMT